MRNNLFILILILFHCFSLGSQEYKTRQDFVPPEPQEEPIFGIFDEIEPADGIAISSLGVISGIFITVGCAYDILDSSINDPYSVKLQQNTIETGVALIGTGIFTLALDFFITKAKESNEK